MFDIFYTGTKPNLFTHEQPCNSLEDAIEKCGTTFFWMINGQYDYSNFDFDWRPDRWEEKYVHIFPSQWQRDSDTYFGKKETAINQEWCYWDKSLNDRYNIRSNSVVLPRTNSYTVGKKCIFNNRQISSQIRTSRSKQDTSRIDQLAVCTNSRIDLIDNYSEVYQNRIHDDKTMFHSGNISYSVEGFRDSPPDDFSNNLRSSKREYITQEVKTLIVQAIRTAPIYEIDFGNKHDKRGIAQHDILQTVRFTDSYLAVLKRIITTTNSEYIWVISSVCDYSNFDFDWHPESFQRTGTHIFKSCVGIPERGNDFGDTFYIHIPTAKKSIGQIVSLEELSGIHYCDDQIVPWYPLDKVPYTGDDLTSIIKQHKFNMPYAIFYPENTDISTLDYTPILWTLKQRLIHLFTESNSIIVAPRDISMYLGVQCYDYPYIMRHKRRFLPENALNIVYISNGEVQAEQWYEHLISITEHDPTLIVKRVKDIKGRANAYKSAAKASDTDWFFTVFGKLEITPDFDWHWQPDRLQEPKHYIFNAYNPVTKLEYGHMGMIAYNKKLVLETNDWGLDFTLSRAHEVVPLLSGIAHYNTDPKATWRTAFREVIKLIQQQDEDSSIRLNSWLTSSGGENGEWSMKGANDAKEYALKYKNNNDYTDRMMKSFEWEWLDNLFHELYT